MVLETAYDLTVKVPHTTIRAINYRFIINKHMTKGEKLKHLQMYFNPNTVESFSKLEQNEKNYMVAEAVDRIIINEIKDIPNPLMVAELGGGAHPDRYEALFKNCFKNLTVISIGLMFQN